MRTKHREPAIADPDLRILFRHTAMEHFHTAMVHFRTAIAHPHTAMDRFHTWMNHFHAAIVHFHTAMERFRTGNPSGYSRRNSIPPDFLGRSRADRRWRVLWGLCDSPGSASKEHNRVFNHETVRMDTKEGQRVIRKLGRSQGFDQKGSWVKATIQELFFACTLGVTRRRGREARQFYEQELP